MTDTLNSVSNTNNRTKTTTIYNFYKDKYEKVGNTFKRNCNIRPVLVIKTT